MTSVHPAEGRQRAHGKPTPFGEKARQIRSEKGMLLIEMAAIAKVSPGFLSLVETGKKPVPASLVVDLVRGLDLNKAQADELGRAAALSAREYRIQLQVEAEPIDRHLAHALQTGFAKMSKTKKQKLLKILEED